MDIDFHYYATYTAAVLAGYQPAEAATIAHAGQYIDDNDPNRMMSADKLGFEAVPSVFTTGQEIMRNSDWSTLTIAHDRAMWTAFHFLPGNINQRETYGGPKAHTGGWGQHWKYDELAEQQFRSMCLPDSPLAVKMVNDTVRQYAGNLHMIGLRMHVLIDTFAHMFYCGSATWHVNEVDEHPEVWNGKGWQRVLIPPFTYSPAVGFYYNSIIYTGHGRMGHVPDLPWVKYRYQPKWSSTPIVKDNPKYYERAFCEMVQAFTCIRNGGDYVPGQPLPEGSPAQRALPRVRSIINTWPRFEELVEGLLNDFPDSRCAVWKKNLPVLAQESGVAIPLPPEYSPDIWLEAANASASIATTDYARWHRAAVAHLQFVKQAVAEAGLTLLGSVPFVQKEHVAHLLGKNLKIKPAKPSSTYWEVENSSTNPNSDVQLWDDRSPRDALNWSLQYAGKGPDGYDRFELYNPTLDRYATFCGRPASAGNQLEGVQIKSEKQGAKEGLQRFALAKHVIPGGPGHSTLTYYSIHVANEYALQPESGNLGNSTKIVAARQGGDDLESWRWEFEHVRSSAGVFPITLDGVLLVGGFRDAAALAKMEAEDKRNTLIVELTKHSNQSGPHYQRCNSEQLVGKGAVALFLLKAGVKNTKQLELMSDDDQRNALIAATEKHTRRGVKELQGMTNRELVRVSFAWLGKHQQ